MHTVLGPATDDKHLFIVVSTFNLLGPGRTSHENTWFHIDNSSDGKFIKVVARWRCKHSTSNQLQLNPAHLQVGKTPR